jgi:hypothetical protein
MRLNLQLDKYHTLLLTSAFATLVPHIYWQCTTITYWLIVREEQLGDEVEDTLGRGSYC